MSDVEGRRDPTRSAAIAFGGIMFGPVPRGVVRVLVRSDLNTRRSPATRRPAPAPARIPAARPSPAQPAGAATAWVASITTDTRARHLRIDRMSVTSLFVAEEPPAPSGQGCVSCRSQGPSPPPAPCPSGKRMAFLMLDRGTRPARGQQKVRLPATERGICRDIGTRLGWRRRIAPERGQFGQDRAAALPDDLAEDGEPRRCQVRGGRPREVRLALCSSALNT